MIEVTSQDHKNTAVPSQQTIPEEDTYLWDENGDKIEDSDAETAEIAHSDSASSLADDGKSSDSDTKEEDKKLRAESFKLASEFGNMGLFLLFALIFSYAIGNFCDKIFGTKPIFTVFWICCGVAATVLETIKNIKKASKLDQTTGTKQ